MKNVLYRLLLAFASFVTHLRYRVKVTGLEHLKKKNQEKGFLFLPNHPTLLIDPIVIATTIMKKTHVRPVVVDFMYYSPILHFILSKIRAIPIPSFSITTNTHKLRRMDRALEEVIRGLDENQNFLFYPAGRVKLTAKEQIGGASGLSKILKDAPQANVVLVRITGLWGSSFSKGSPRHAVDMSVNVFDGIKATLKNLIFFNPKRDVLIEFVEAPLNFPYHEPRAIQNRWLENWYNKTGEFAEPEAVAGEPLYLVPYSMWSKEIDSPIPLVNEEETVDLEKVPAIVYQKVIAKLSEMSDIPEKSILPKMSLATDLGIDSLDAAEIAIFLEEQFEIKDIPGDELTSVRKILGIASGQVSVEAVEEMKFDFSKWKVPHQPRLVHLDSGKTLQEVFLKTCSRMGKQVACGDERLGVLTYSDLKIKSIILAEKIKEMPGLYVGILLPSSAVSMVLVFATLLAGKIPVMINWTIGSRHVNAVIEATGLQVCLSSWAFLDRLSNVDLGKLVDLLVQVEDIAQNITWKDKLKGFAFSMYPAAMLRKKYEIDKLSSEETAVLLFTSGSEGAPKGVPLSHYNVLSNIDSITDDVKLYENDVFFSMLPPFHSFGFTICGVTPLLLGIKAVFHPNPTEGNKIAKGIEKWKATVICGAPTFLKNIFKSAKSEQLQSLRYIVTGAEKASDELYDLGDQFGVKDRMFEGYGITECSPVLTLNHPGEERKGVGRPLKNIMIEIINPDTHVKLGINQQGLILAHGPNVFSGYLNSTSDPFVNRDGKRWYVTGDLGYLDDKGRLTITGRVKRFVKVGSEMISLGSIEESFLEQRDKLGQIDLDQGPIIACCARETPGEKPRFYLFTTFPLSLDKANVLLKQSGFSNLVRIHQVHQLPKIPLMGSGKISYRQLEDEFIHEKSE